MLDCCRWGNYKPLRPRQHCTVALGRPPPPGGAITFMKVVTPDGGGGRRAMNRNCNTTVTSQLHLLATRRNPGQALSTTVSLAQRTGRTYCIRYNTTTIQNLHFQTSTDCNAVHTLWCHDDVYCYPYGTYTVRIYYHYCRFARPDPFSLFFKKNPPADG